ncbi:hypothetical protein BIFGAL_03787 [Bifidobacterium gallicum DSM 20093 = LMG 11596]|nr:hypothetical protein BIFGAL_03787 [Bifidobacterium gallicum DSM 20093 = LMG 11596]
MAIVLTLAGGACSVPRVAGQAEANVQLSACDKAMRRATRRTQLATGTAFATRDLRFAMADAAEHDWVDVAIQCPTRFEQGTLRSAQMQWLAQQLAKRVQRNYTALIVTRLDGLTDNVLPGATLAQLALSEDRVGFATEVLAGRRAVAARTNGLDGSTALAALSDDHKQASSELMSLAGNTQDLRRKVYATQTLVDSPDTMVDPATGLSAPTVAVLEMNCAREELATVQQALPNVHIDDDAKANATLDNELCQLSLLIATHAVTAFQMGYPSFDLALFSATPPAAQS